jgi:hypothetical protein
MQRKKLIKPTVLALKCISGRIGAYPVEIDVCPEKKDREMLMVDGIVAGRPWALTRQQ